MNFFIKLLRKLSSKPKRLNPEIYKLVADGSREALIIYVTYCNTHHQEKFDYQLYHKGLLTSAEQGNVDSLYDMGYFHTNGLIEFPQDYKQATECFLKAAEKGHSAAMNYLALFHYKGLGVEVDEQKMRAWYEKSASLGNPDALSNLGNIYAEGLGVELDYVKAKDYFLMAAEKGNANAMNNLSYLYSQGLGVEKDEALADEWLEKAHNTKAKQPVKLGIMNS